MDIVSPLVDRGPALTSITRALTDNGRLVLHGAAGIGKSTMFRELVAAQHRPSLTARALPDSGPFTTAIELLGSVEDTVIKELPPQWRQTLVTLLTEGAEPPGDRIKVQLAILEVLQRLSARSGVLVAVDDAHWMDSESREVLRFGLRNLRPARLAMLLTSDQAALAGTVGGGCLPVPVPPWTVSELSELLAGQGLPSRFAGRIHQSCGGNPTLALQLGSVIAMRRPTVEPPRTPGAFRMAATRLDRLTIRARRTLLLAALAGKPNSALLRRTGRRHARQDLDAAVRAELITIDAGGDITFSAGVIADVLRSDADEMTRMSSHLALAEAETDPVAAIWHRAMAEAVPSAEMSADLEQAATEIDRRGEPRRAARFAMLAAARTPVADEPARLRRYLAAAGYASVSGDSQLTKEAAAAALDLVTDPADRVRVQLTLIEVAGQALDSVDDIFAEIGDHAAGHPALLAEVELRRAWRAHICDGDIGLAIEHCEKALALATESTARVTRIEALTAIARMKLSRGDSDAEELLDEAEELYDLDDQLPVNGTAQFVRGRQALFEDRIDQAREHLLTVLPMARRQGRVTGLVDVLRSLAEVELRAGRCSLAKEYSHQAMRHAAQSETSPSPAWYVASLVESATGSPARSRMYAAQGLRSSREDRDILYTTRNLFALGRVHLLGGDAVAAAQTLLKVQSLETTNDLVDPSVLQWHTELVEALASAGRLAEATGVLADGRASAARFDRAAVDAQLDRAEGVLRQSEGDLVKAESLLERAADKFEKLGLPLERGRSLVSLARLQRRRNDIDAARAALDAAGEIFTVCGADAWIRLTNDERQLLESHGRNSSPLTNAESRVAELVADGASNRETAESLFVSVKTIEAILTRVYRKLGVKSRTQLAALWNQRREAV